MHLEHTEWGILTYAPKSYDDDIITIMSAFISFIAYFYIFAFIQHEDFLTIHAYFGWIFCILTNLLLLAIVYINRQELPLVE